MIPDKVKSRLRDQRIIWLASVTTQNKPHLVPIWYVISAERVWICTPSGSKKIRNIIANPAISISLEDGAKPQMGEGTASLIQGYPEEISRLFKQKYDWDIITDDEYDQVVSLNIEKWVLS
ncbi:MAG: pyridoxamine 5'-phosphate oxidase family protein [Candidatus Kariarchaeaceae archaeon]|jgi:nitroimidazol reductase NimA-like FMN-containing flavoprotein (pyridoxamine 5'-phosphate oxidase superfamily)